MSIAVGGKTFGKGFTGFAEDTACASHDHDTFCAYVNNVLRRGSETAILLHGLGRTSAVTVNDPVRFLAFLTRQKGMITKVFLGSQETQREKFLGELREMRKLRAALPARQLSVYTTVQELEYQGSRFVGIELTPHRGAPPQHFLFSRKCSKNVEQIHEFTTSSLLGMVTDTLHGFQLLHENGLIHGDVKAANVVHCPHDAVQFKLIDWGLMEKASELVKRYSEHKKPKNYSSPLSWYLWGVWRYMSYAMFVGYYMYKAADPFFSNPDFRAFIKSCLKSFHAFMSAQPNSSERRQLLKRYAYTFDLFNLGVMYARISLDDKLCRHVSSTARRAVLELARRMTHYGDDDFFMDARHAASWWARNKRTRAA